MRLAVLGSGSVGTAVAKLVASHPQVDELVLADRDEALAAEAAASLGRETSVRVVDVTDAPALARLLSDVDLVFNAVGPFYRHGLPVLRSAVEAGVHYVDICDDADVALSALRDGDLQDAARRAGIVAVLGIGHTPGTTNLLAMHAASQMDTVHTVHFQWAVPFIVTLSHAIVDHLLHCFEGDVTQFIDGSHVEVPAGSGRELVTLQPPFTTYEFAYSGHSESVTIPLYLDGVRDVTVKSTFFQPEGWAFYRALIASGLTNTGLPTVAGVRPRDLVVDYVASGVAETVVGVDLSSHPFAAVERVEVLGERSGGQRRVVYEVHNFLDGIDPAIVATPAALCLAAILEGKVHARGVHAPEGCLDAREILPPTFEMTKAQVYRQVDDIGLAEF